MPRQIKLDENFPVSWGPPWFSLSRSHSLFLYLFYFYPSIFNFSLFCSLITRELGKLFRVRAKCVEYTSSLSPLLQIAMGYGGFPKVLSYISTWTARLWRLHCFTPMGQHEGMGEQGDVYLIRQVLLAICLRVVFKVFLFDFNQYFEMNNCSGDRRVFYFWIA